MAKTDEQAIARERLLRKWAAGIISDLPPDEEDSRRVLELAREMFETTLTRRALVKRPARLRAA